ncbi:MAG: hypothetical protein WB579_05310 [Bryobacteraceae bacterium]
MKRALITALTSACVFCISMLGQTGTKLGGLVLPGNTWNQHPFAIFDSTSNVYRYYWSCGNTDGICVGQVTLSGVSSYLGQAATVNSQVCDLQDPGVVKFNNTYYLYAEGDQHGPSGDGCLTNNEHAAIYGFSSSDGVHFSALNNGNPVLQLPPDAQLCWTCYTGHGLAGPTPVVMGLGTSNPFIRLYYWYQAPGYGLISNGNGIESVDSTNGETFVSWGNPGSTERVILTQGYWQQVKRVGLYGDYPMVMTVNNGGGSYTLVSSGYSDQYWTWENGNQPFSVTPSAGYAPHLESDVTGLLLDTNSTPVTVPKLNSGEQLNLDWDNGATLGNSFIYRGSTTGLNLFPDLNKDPAPWINEFIPSSYPNNQGVQQTFYVQGVDYASGSAITYLQPFLSNSSNLSNLTNSCHVLYASSNNTLYLDSSAGNFSWVGSQPFGGSWSGSNSNGVCQVNSWSTSVSGNYLTLTVNWTFLQNLTWWEFASATNATGNSPWLTNGLTWIY